MEVATNDEGTDLQEYMQCLDNKGGLLGAHAEESQECIHVLLCDMPRT